MYEATAYGTARLIDGYYTDLNLTKSLNSMELDTTIVKQYQLVYGHE